MWSRYYRSVARHFLRFYVHYSVTVMIVSVATCIFAEPLNLDFLYRGELGYGHMKGGINFAFVMLALSAPIFYMVLGLFLVWIDELNPSRAFRNLVVGAAIAILSHAIVYNKGHFLLSDPGNALETKLKLYNSLYFSIVTFTTLGYGDFAPDPPYRLIAALRGIYGYIFLGTLVGMMTTFVSGPSRGSKQKDTQNAKTADNGGKESDNP